ncbi:MAG: hypothetical protein CBB67_007370 [Alteromonadaceae bacterium TMED7]|nr:hypothetical protein [Alteromonadaceae bacterium]RPH20007.1 MAG: hypothetical protein CBB67_007370 [Alteromonadaceae bacterium TMED7]
MYLITRPLAKLATTDSAFAEAGLSASVIALQQTKALPAGIARLQALLKTHPDAVVIVTSTAAAAPPAGPPPSPPLAAVPAVSASWSIPALR